MTMENLAVLDVVALLSPCGKAPTGAVGTIVEVLEPSAFLIEFSDDSGRALAFESVPSVNLLKLHYDLVHAE
jgi:hypothetical protein